MTDPADRVATSAALLELDPRPRSSWPAPSPPPPTSRRVDHGSRSPGMREPWPGAGPEHPRRVQLALANFLTMATRGGPPTPRCPSRRARPRHTTSGAGGAQRSLGRRAPGGLPDRGQGVVAALLRGGGRLQRAGCDGGALRRAGLSPTSTSCRRQRRGARDEVATTGRVRERYLERLARQQLTCGEDAARWRRPRNRRPGAPAHADGILLPQHHVPAVLGHLGSTRCTSAASCPAWTRLRTWRCCWCPTAPGRAGAPGPAPRPAARRPRPARPWTEAHLSYERARRARSLPRTRAAVDTEARSGAVLTADPSALATCGPAPWRR